MKQHTIFLSRILIGLSIGFLGCRSKTKEFTELPRTVFEKSGGTESPSYQENIAFWQKISELSKEVRLWEIGPSDAGKPIHLVLWNAGNIKNWEEIRQSNKAILLINNGIHPGEPDGIDACQMLIKELLEDPEKAKAFKDVIVALVPVYNVGGALNRNSFSRANQEGPVAYGFRGNAQNLDLNRDCIKMDSKNAFALANLFHKLDPDLFMDTHVSNGADYQHVVTLLSTQEQKLGGPLGEFYKKEMTPFLFKRMKEMNFPMIPYVNVWGRAPQNGGIYQFMDWPRYTNGFAALHHVPAYTVETHMLKKFADRVEGTQRLLLAAMELLQEKGSQIKAIREAQKDQVARAEYLTYHWELDSTKADTVEFLAYKYMESASKLNPELKISTYDTLAPFKSSIPYFCYYNPIKRIKKPTFFAIPPGYSEIVNKLKANGVAVKTITRDTTVEARVFTITHAEQGTNPYEKHFLHYNTQYAVKTEEVLITKGTHVIFTGTEKDRLLIETLTPDATDSYFNWNAFDAILQQKEGFSPYVWDAKAAAILAADSDLNQAFQGKVKTEKEFAENLFAQHYWVYSKSPFYEKAHLRYPVLWVD